MEQSTLVLGLVIVLALAFFYLMDRRWRKRVEEAGSEPGPQAMWMMMQQQMDQLRSQMNEGLSKTISLLTEQLRAINEQVSQQLHLVGGDAVGAGRTHRG